MSMTTLKHYQHFDGLPWATGYAVNALAYQGVSAPHTGQPYTEAMLMGINGGLSAGYFVFEYTGYDPHLHFLTRYIFNDEPGAYFERLGIPTTARNTTDPEKAVANVVAALAKGQPAIVWLDMASLDYNYGMSNTFTAADNHDIWMINPVLVYGYDQAAGRVRIADRARVGLDVSAESFARARARIAKTKHRMMTIDAPNPDRLPAAIKAGIQACLDIFSGKSPSPVNFGFEGYKKWARLLTESKGKNAWAKQFAPGVRMYSGLTTAYQTIELFFTGGRGARHLYADFLDEAAIVLGKAALREVAETFRAAAGCWDALLATLLPEKVAPLRDARELMTRNYDLFLAQGGASLPERRQIIARLEALKERMKTDFPLGETEAATMRAEIAERVMAIHDAELVALEMLRAATA
jgi:hypothetical protein